MLVEMASGTSGTPPPSPKVAVSQGAVNSVINPPSGALGAAVGSLLANRSPGHNVPLSQAALQNVQG